MLLSDGLGITPCSRFFLSSVFSSRNFRKKTPRNAGGSISFDWNKDRAACASVGPPIHPGRARDRSRSGQVARRLGPVEGPPCTRATIYSLPDENANTTFESVQSTFAGKLTSRIRELESLAAYPQFSANLRIKTKKKNGRGQCSCLAQSKLRASPKHLYSRRTTSRVNFERCRLHPFGRASRSV
jgi:hypothetical protein